MTESARYIKIVEWSEEDQCFVGQCPGLIGPCCHGDDEKQVYAELCQIVDEWIDTLKRNGRPLPPPTAGKNVAQKISCSESKFIQASVAEFRLLLGFPSISADRGLD